jgi:tetratricopeptide (TPR) repeat protein/tRNA A-37 threonylcarbamoyl transferase component Bud32
VLVVLGLALPIGAAHAGDLAALPPRAPAAQATLARGAAEWVRVRFAEAGFASNAGFAFAGELPVDRSRAIPPRAKLAAFATDSGVARAWVLELEEDRGKATLALGLIETATGEPVAAARIEQPLAEIGAALAKATDDVLLQAGAAGKTPMPPTAAELVAYGRAVERIERVRLADAWRQLGGRSTPTADALRAQIDARAGAEALPVGEGARLSVARGDSERARLVLRSEIASHRDDPVLALAAAEAAEEMGEAERALPLFDRALELDASSEGAQQGRVRALIRAGRVDEAIEAMDALPDLDPLVVEPLAESPALDAPVRAHLHLRAAQLHRARLDVAQAQDELARATQLDAGTNAVAQRESALLYVATGLPAQALAAAEQAVELGGADAPLLGALGAARQAAGDAQGARQAYEKARAAEPEDVVALRGLGELAIAAGEVGPARELLGEVVTLAPEQHAPRLTLVSLLRSGGDLDGALALLDRTPGGTGPAELGAIAAIRKERGDQAGARATLEEAREIAPADAQLLGQLAGLREESGDVEAARALRLLAGRFDGGNEKVDTAESGPAKPAKESVSIGLSELATSFPQKPPGYDGKIEVVALLAPSLVTEPGFVERWLAPRRIALGSLGEEIARALGTRFEVVGPGEIPRELSVAEQTKLRAFQEDESSVARMNDALGSDAVFVVRVRPADRDESLPGALHLDVRMEVGSDPAAVRRFANQAWIMDGLEQHAEWNPSAIVLASLLLVLAALPFVRGWGELQVGIQYASLGKGFFSIKLSRKPSRAELGAAQKGNAKYLRKTRMMGRFERAMVDKETLFRWLPARRWYVTVHGLLQDPSTDDVVGNYAAEQMVVIQRGKQARLDFDFRMREAALELSVMNGDAPYPGARVAIRGMPDSVRYARNGSTIVYLPPGLHRVLIATDDAVFEREISIEGFAPRALTQNMQDENALIFKDCADAVEPYITGNLLGAAEALREGGQEGAAANVRGEHFAAIGDTKEAARAFERAGRLEDAASLLSGNADAASAAELFEQAGNHEKAAQAFEAAGDDRRAAKHYEAVYRYEDAVECYRRSGDVEKVCELLEKLARYFEAGQAALETGDTDRAIRNLQAIEARDGDYVRACTMLGQIFRDRGEHELAVQKLDEAVAVGGGESAPLELVEQLARAQEQAGRAQQALTTWESIRARDFHYPAAAEKLESLRNVVDVERETRATLEAGGGAAAEDSRYEILGEVGRGGMGVVFKARDKRLGRVVALKRLPDNLRNHPTAVRLFLREARAAAALNHRNIVTLFDAGQEGDQYFLTMELLEGFPLLDVLNKRGKLSARDAARLAVQACAGLEYAHAQGVVHRDIKTSNLFFTRDRVLKIMDFGLAKMTEEVRRAATVIGGTPYYMAPEQAAGEEVDHRADQYALGVTLFELVTGDVPFRDGDVTYHHRHTPPPNPCAKAPELPEEFAQVILKLMAKRREDRFDKTGDAGAAIQKIAKRLSE